MAKIKKRSRELTPDQKRAQIYEDGKAALAKLKAGEALTVREARLLRKMHKTFLELYEVFRPTIISTLKQQGRDIESALQELEADEDYEEEDEE